MSERERNGPTHCCCTMQAQLMRLKSLLVLKMSKQRCGVRRFFNQLLTTPSSQNLLTLTPL